MDFTATSDPSVDPRPTAARRQRNRSTTTPSRKPEPSFYTPNAAYSWMSSPSRSRRRRRAVVFCGVGSRSFGGRRWSARWGESTETNEPYASRSRERVCEPYGNLRCLAGLLRCLAQTRVAPSCLPRRSTPTLELDIAARFDDFPCKSPQPSLRALLGADAKERSASENRNVPVNVGMTGRKRKRECTICGRAGRIGGTASSPPSTSRSRHLKGAARRSGFLEHVDTAA